MTTGIIKKENGPASTPATSFRGLLDHFFQNNLSRFFEDDLWGFNGVRQNTNIPVNIRETDKSYEMDLVVPGLKKEDFAISVQGEQLTISLEHKDQNQQENTKENWLRKEYKVQSFSRSFTLDDSLDSNNITAGYQDGILRLSLPKKELGQRVSRNIEIK